MLIDDQLSTLLSNGELSQPQLTVLFHALDQVGVSALWVDANFENYSFNTANKLMKNAVEKTGPNRVSYKDLVSNFGSKNNSAQDIGYVDDYPPDWMQNMHDLQSRPMTPQEDYVVLTSSGKHFLSRRVFLNDGSMLVISFDYANLRDKDGLMKAVFKMSKSGAACYSINDDSFYIESPYLERILTPEEHAGVKKHGLFHIIHPDDLESSKEIFKRSLSSTEPVSKNIRLTTQKDGELWFKYTGRLEKSEDGQSDQHISIFEDITEEIKIHDNLRQNIQRSNTELKERLDFMAKLSHELKTPMNAIVGISDALLHSGDVAENVKAKLEIIQSSSEILVNMLDQTLSHAKLKTENTSLNLQPHSPAKVVGDICKLWEHQALKTGTRIRFDIDPNIPSSIMIDRMRLGQCLNNLISNATKFTEYGSIEVILKLHSPKNQPQQLAIVVRDNGIGMTEEQVKQVFTAYKQADETIASRFGGTGLGMSITKELIELMGGKITVKSVPDKGTLFLILLPIKLADTEMATDIFQSSPSAVIQPEKTITDTQEATPASQDKEQPIPERQETQTPHSALAVSEASELSDSTSVEPEKLTPSQRLMAKLDVKTTELEKLNVLVVDDNETNHIVMTSLLESVVGKIYSAYNGKEALNTLKIEHIDICLLYTSPSPRDRG